MKVWITRLSLLVLVTGLLAPTSVWAEQKIALIDLDEAFNKLDRTKQGHAKVEEDKKAFQDEINTMKEELKILREEHAADCGGVMHCFTETWEMAQAALDLNFYISFSGIVTFKNAADLRDVAARVPADRLLIETDSPYLAPVPFRGKPNEPRYVGKVAEAVADVRGISSDELIEISHDNFFRLFSAAG